jgi:hypothetical protein
MRQKIMGSRVALALVLLMAAALPGWAQSGGGPTAAMDGEWHFTVAPYMWFSGIKGDVSVGNLPPIAVEAPISDILSNLDIALEGHFAARKDRVGLAFDFIWSDLGVPVAEDVEFADFTVDIRQFVSEGYVFYRAASGGNAERPAHLDLLVGARYTGTRARLQAERAGVEYDGEFQELDWVDLMGGLKFRAPLGSRFALLGRGDVAGLGSQVTWNLEGDLVFLASERWALGAGWRYMDIDYEKDDTVIPQRFNLAYNGPRLWFAYSW